uniref:uncharacterized protein LOC122603107 n=1 Tax=Erigeron canadensis TaxID=72917 RepID=UPI001CB9AE88|nr:uncharacterized protein LOC122603107 [Erigeron canadensis]
MSRCFPYPRNGASSSASYEALIESIKLQKETERALKAERKKEKRERKENKERRHKHKEKHLEKGKSVLNQNELLQDSYKTVDLKEALEKKLRTETEQLEKSDLSEEHGPSINQQKPSYSSDSTQNSNKRKRDDSTLPDASSGYGKPIKIRLLKKQKGAEVPMEIDQPVPLATRPYNETPVMQNRKANGFSATYGTENRTLSVLETKNDALQGLDFVRTQPASSFARVIPPATNLKQQIPSSQMNNNELPLLNASRQLPVSGYGRTVVPVSGVDIDLPGPSSVVPPVPSASRLVNMQRVCLDSNMSRALDTGKRPINEFTAPANDGLTRLEKQKDPVIEAPPLSRHEKKVQKKHIKYEKLIGSWVPPLLEALQKPDDDEDWLSRRVQTVKSSARDIVKPSQELPVSSLWQPCARFLVDADIHALPFTVPF